jgi:hypothetical protein
MEEDRRRRNKSHSYSHLIFDQDAKNMLGKRHSLQQGTGKTAYPHPHTQTETRSLSLTLEKTQLKVYHRS